MNNDLILIILIILNKLLNNIGLSFAITQVHESVGQCMLSHRKMRRKIVSQLLK